MRNVMLITGTRKGIGRYLADYYVQKEFAVIGCSRGDVDQRQPGYEHYCVDIADEEAVRSMVHDVAARYGQINVLINNAGIASMNHLLLTPVKTVEKIMATNVLGTFLVAREVAKVMVRQKRGRIVNFATVATPLKLEGEAIYAASKAAVHSLTETMARELAPYKITVNAVGPTPVATDLIRSVPRQKIDDLIARQAVKRLGEFRDISNVIDFFIREESDFVTGQVVYLGGIS